MFGPISRAVFVAALVLPFTACSQPAENTAPSYAIPEPTPPDPVQVAQEAEYRDQLAAGQKALDAKNTDTAITHFERAVTTKPRGFEAQLHLARLYAAKKDDAKAVKAYSAATAANPRLGEAYMECAAIHERTGQLEDARQEYTQLIREELDPKLTAKAYWLRSELADRIGKRSDYRYDREQAMKLDFNYASKVTSGDVRVFNHSDKGLNLKIDQLINPDGTERTFPPGYQFSVGEGDAYLTDNGRPLAARSLRYTLVAANSEKTRSYTATYQRGATLEIHVYEADVPR